MKATTKYDHTNGGCLFKKAMVMRCDHQYIQLAKSIIILKTKDKQQQLPNTSYKAEVVCTGFLQLYMKKAGYHKILVEYSKVSVEPSFLLRPPFVDPQGGLIIEMYLDRGVSD